MSSRKESVSMGGVVLDRVTVRYGGIEALRDASLDIDRGEIVALLGPNGAGKSTLLRALTGVVAPAGGTVTLFGQPLGGLDRLAVAKTTALVAQSSEVAFGYTVRDVVMMGRAPYQGSWMAASPEDTKAVEEAMAALELGPLASRRVDALSGGEQKRVAIARALAQSPKLLLLDEPGAFLDVRHQLALYDMLVTLAARGMTIVLSMHDINAAAQYASRIVLLKAGSIVAAGSVEEVLTYTRLKETFDADLYCGVNDLTGARFFLPMRKQL